MTSQMTTPMTTQVLGQVLEAGSATTVRCRHCAGTGWADPWEVDGGTPKLTTCDRCLGVGLDGCPDCDGDGTIALPVSCRCQTATSA